MQLKRITTKMDVPRPLSNDMGIILLRGDGNEPILDCSINVCLNSIVNF